MMRRADSPRRGIRALLPALVVAWSAMLLPLGAVAHSYRFDQIAVGHVWAPPTAQDAAGAPVYGPLLNRGEAEDSLVGASSPIAERVRFRVSKDGDVRWPDAIVLEPGEPLGLARWRVHIWLTGLKRPLKDGDRFELTLTFARAGIHTVEVFVEKSPDH